MTTIAFDAGSWLNAADETVEVLTALKPAFDSAVSGTRMDNRGFRSPVDIAIVIGLDKRNAESS